MSGLEPHGQFLVYRDEQVVEQYLVFTEGQTRRRIPMRMGDWIIKLDGLLTPNDRDSAGKVSHDLAAEHASAEFEKYRQQESATVESDFVRFTRRILGEGTNDG